jgi:hypothetical protein
MSTTAEAVKAFSWFVLELRQAQVKGLPGLTPASVAATIHEQAENVAGELKHPAAMGLILNTAKMTLGFRLAFEAGEMGWLAHRESIDLVIAETVKHLEGLSDPTGD